MAGSRRRRNRGGISKVDPTQQVAMLEQRSLHSARGLERSEPVRVAVPVGTLADGQLARVDPAGMVQLEGAEWVLDWWVGAEDRWHFTSSDPTVMQTLVGSSPIIRTTVRVPGGEIIQNVFGAQASIESPNGRWAGGAVVVEIENQSAVPVALALAIRPVTLWADGSIASLGSDGSTISVNGSPVALLSKPASRRVVGPPGTVAIRLDLEDDEEPDGTWSIEGQQAEGAFIVPLPHTAVMRVLLPADLPAEFEASSRGGTTGLRHVDQRVAWEAPGAEQVEAGWRSLSQGMFSVSCPEPLLERLSAASMRFLSVIDNKTFDQGVGDCSAALRNALLAEALVTSGAVGGLEPLARAFADAERLRGGIRMADRSDASAALIHCAGPLLIGQRSEHWSEILLGPVAKAIHRLERGKSLRASPSGENALQRAELVHSAALAAARIAPALLHIGQPELAAGAHDLYHRLVARAGELDAGEEQQLGTGSAVPPHSSRTPQDHDGHSDRARYTQDQGLQIRRLIRAGAHGASEAAMRFAGLGHLGILPAEVDADGSPLGAVAIDPAATALRLALIMDLFVRETSMSIELLPCWSDLWFEKPVEVSNVATRLGNTSFALRWHESRPILLWEIEPGVGVDSESLVPVVTAPGLDPTWHGHGWSGEAILGTMSISQAAADAIAERDRPKMSVSLGAKKRPAPADADSFRI